MKILCALILMTAWTALALDAEPAPVDATQGSERAPAQESTPGHTNPDELKVQAQLPDAQQKKDARSLQNEVYKSIYNRELKPDQREDVLEE
jgi:DNA/RNA endonuclease G (NUC1)